MFGGAQLAGTMPPHLSHGLSGVDDLFGVEAASAYLPVGAKWVVAK
jgi:hypothetical protein